MYIWTLKFYSKSSALIALALFTEVFKTPLLPKQYSFGHDIGHNIHHPLCVMCQMSHVKCHMSCVTCDISCVTCHMLHDIITPELLELGT